MGIYFAETPEKIYGSEFIKNKKELEIHFIENAE